MFGKVKHYWKHTYQIDLQCFAIQYPGGSRVLLTHLRKGTNTKKSKVSHSSLQTPSPERIGHCTKTGAPGDVLYFQRKILVRHTSCSSALLLFRGLLPFPFLCNISAKFLQQTGNQHYCYLYTSGFCKWLSGYAAKDMPQDLR